MTLEDIQFELEMAGVSGDKVMKLISFTRSNGFDPKALDAKLRTFGIAPVFELYYDDEEEEQEQKK